MNQKKIEIAVLAIHRPFRAPNERYRWHQYSDFLTQNNIRADYFYIVNEQDDKILFHSDNLLMKIIIYTKTFFKRWKQIKNLKHYDAVLIYRELHWFSLFTKLFLKIIRRKTPKIIFDFDDAIWLAGADIFTNLFKQPTKKTIIYIQFADKIIAGNSYLENFAKQYNKNVTIIPTCVDTDYFVPSKSLLKDNITIGWMGSHSTIQHLLLIIPALKHIQKKYPQAQFKFIGKKFFIKDLNTWIEDWKADKEIETLNSFDIGIMPLPDDEWSKGKCGLKILTYLSCEIPAVASNTGVNAEIINKTNGGLLVNNSTEEWINALSSLIENPQLRIQFGKQGRAGTEKYYSLKKWQSEFLNTITH